MGKRHTKEHMAAMALMAREKRGGYGSKIPTTRRRVPIADAETPCPVTGFDCLTCGDSVCRLRAKAEAPS